MSARGGLIPSPRWRTQICGFPLTVPRRLLPSSVAGEPDKIDGQSSSERGIEGGSSVKNRRIAAVDRLPCPCQDSQKGNPGLKDRCLWVLQFERVVLDMQFHPPARASVQTRYPHGNPILAQSDTVVTADPEATVVLPPRWRIRTTDRSAATRLEIHR